MVDFNPVGLRLNNFVRIKTKNDDSEQIITAIYDYKIKCDLGDIYFDIDYIYGIPLIEEWPLKFGLKNVYDIVDDEFNFGMREYFKHIFHICDELFLGDYKGEWFICVKGFGSDEQMYLFPIGVKIEAVHQLQNLCFALTGEELILK